MTPMTSNLKRCNLPKWELFLRDYDFYQTEEVFRGGYVVTLQRILPSKRVIAECHTLPNGMKGYFHA